MRHMISKCVICEQVWSAENKIYAKRKKYIQDRFRTETGLLVDVVLQGIIYYEYIQF
jgi:hypothetical protein